MRKRGLLAAAEMKDQRFVDPLLNLMDDTDPQTRIKACYAAYQNWNQKFAEPLLRLSRGPELGVAGAALGVLRSHLPVLRGFRAATRLFTT